MTDARRGAGRESDDEIQRCEETIYQFWANFTKLRHECNRARMSRGKESLTQKDVADKADIPPSTLSTWVSGKVCKVPEWPVCKQLTVAILGGVESAEYEKWELAYSAYLKLQELRGSSPKESSAELQADSFSNDRHGSETSDNLIADQAADVADVDPSKKRSRTILHHRVVLVVSLGVVAAGLGIVFAIPGTEPPDSIKSPDVNRPPESSVSILPPGCRELIQYRAKEQTHLVNDSGRAVADLLPGDIFIHDPAVLGKAFTGRLFGTAPDRNLTGNALIGKLNFDRKVSRC
jgi:DNA-binding XRE family transcriptional regulator